MTYAFPPSLYPLRDYLKGQGADTKAFVSARQAAFMAQQLLGTRVKFPAQGADMTSTLFLIQKAVTEKGLHSMETPGRAGAGKKAGNPKKGRSEKVTKSFLKGKKKKDYSKFTPELFADGIHVFADGASVPNPGVGGWGVVAYNDGVEISSSFGGEAQTTNNIMELTALINAIEMAGKLSGNSGQLVTVWCDSQYCVRGINEWMKGWKANGWQRGHDGMEPQNRVLLNCELWKAIDQAVAGYTRFGKIVIRWVKGHIGVAGNERADELAEMGRQLAADKQAGLLIDPAEDLDERYRQIMGAM